MPTSTRATLEIKNVADPDERRQFDHGTLDVVNLPGATIVRAVFGPGWRWSTDIKPVVGTDSCQVAHSGYVISGRFHVRMDDGREYDLGPGDAHVVSPGHDAWVVGEEPCVIVDFAATGSTLPGHVGRCPCGVEFRVAGDEQLEHLVAAVREHASASHGHQISPDEVMAALDRS